MEKPIVEMLNDVNELWTLENAFLNEIGEPPMDGAAQKRLMEAIKQEKIFFFVAKNGSQPIGMCSISPSFSTFACKPCGVFDDFYVHPEFRRQGVARLLVKTAQDWCREHDYASVTVGCSRQDEAMYHSLGFDTELGVMLAVNL